MKLVCVVFMEESPNQFTDTIQLFNYGFENFQKLMVNENETNYKIDNLDSFDTSNDLFGNSTPLMTMEDNAYIILPNTASFDDAVSNLEYADPDESSNLIASIKYTYSDVPVGNCNIYFSKAQEETFDFAADSDLQTRDSTVTNSSDQTTNSNVIFINVKKVIWGILAIAGIIIFILILISFINSYSFSPRGQSNKRRRQRSKEARAAKRSARRNARLFKKQQRKRRKEYKKRH